MSTRHFEHHILEDKTSWPLWRERVRSSCEYSERNIIDITHPTYSVRTPVLSEYCISFSATYLVLLRGSPVRTSMVGVHCYYSPLLRNLAISIKIIYKHRSDHQIDDCVEDPSSVDRHLHINPLINSYKIATKRLIKRTWVLWFVMIDSQEWLVYLRPKRISKWIGDTCQWVAHRYVVVPVHQV